MNFRCPSNYIKKLRRKDKFITGKSRLSSSTRGNFRGAPEPDQHLFIYRVENEATSDDIAQHVISHDITIRNLECVSNPNAKFKSFKLTVPVSDHQVLFDDQLWPNGVRVRKFIPPRPT